MPTGLNGEYVPNRCGRCGGESSPQGHFFSLCSVLFKRTRGDWQKSKIKHHFCCPGDCEINGDSNK